MAAVAGKELARGAACVRPGRRTPAALLPARFARCWLMLACLGAGAATAADCQLSAGSQLRVYQHERRVPNGYDSLASATFELECDQRFDDGAQAVNAKIFGRIAQHGSRRNYLDVRELVWSAKSDPWQLRAGIDQVFWGVTEFAHIVDIVNQSDLLEDPIGEAKFGQPMASASLRRPWGTLTAFALPWFRDRLYADLEERLRPVPRLEYGKALFESRRGRDHLDWALRYSHVSGPLDIGLSYFDGTNRDPLRVFQPHPDGSVEIRPFYQQISQLGLDAQLTFGEWLFKLEGARRHSSGTTRDAYSLGLEYALVGIGGTPADLNIAFEYAHDSRTPAPVPEFFNEDWSLGFRLSLNDERSTEARFGIIYDPQLSSQGWALDFASRIAAKWRLAAELRLFRRLAAVDPLHTLDGDDYLDISLTRYF